MFPRTLLIAVLCGLVAAPALAKDYHAERFDSRIEVRSDGSLLVTETMVFRFESGTFKTVFRTIPTRRTDGIEFVRASMDGQVLPTGDGPGTVEVRRKNGLRVDWRFDPVTASTHTFQLVYIARGVVRREEGVDLLAWRALPSEHGYRIAESVVEIEAPAKPVRPATVAARRVDGGTSITSEGDLIVIRASDIRRNGWVEPEVGFPAGALVAAPPAWQARAARQAEMAGTWAIIAAGVLFAGFVLLVAMRQNYDAPPRSHDGTWSSLIPPDDLPPALAGALAANGHPNLSHAMAAVFALAERGVLSISEGGKTLGHRTFAIRRERIPPQLAPHEEAVIETIFRKAGAGETVSLSHARNNLAFHSKPFREAVYAELRDLGLLDENRRRHRFRYNVIGVTLFMVAAVSVVGVFLVRDVFGAWPLLITAALAFTGLAACLFAASETPLSNEGVRRGDAWRGYRAHVRKPQEIEPRWGATEAAEWRVLPFVIALGVAGAWAKFMKKRNVRTPAWFQPASEADGGPAFATFVAYSAATSASGGAGGVGGGGTAGGGASGAG